MKLPKTPSLRLDGKRALVTGAGRGIGLAAAAALAQASAHVILAARTASEIEAASSQMRDDGGSAEPLVLDVTDQAAVRVLALSLIVRLVGRPALRNPGASYARLCLGYAVAKVLQHGEPDLT